MSYRLKISKKNRAAVHKRAKGYCEYCACPSDHSPSPFCIDHILPIILGGLSVLENLALACFGCNRAKYMLTQFADPISNVIVPIYNPRTDKWAEHFYWSDDYLQMVGLTATGRATINALQLNRASVINLRRALMANNLHPPEHIP
ncbi:MAG TPA: HNH endonuclease [Bacteroidetes bacterium]|nr:HNH endonuclease [Bacteroidota bacterium]